jgi:xylan 1,4-beta-xylosidase
MGNTSDVRFTRREALQYGGAALAAGSLLNVGTARAATASGALALNAPTEPFPHVWERAVSGDWAKQALRRDYQDQLLEAHRDLGIESLRFHGALSTAMSVYVPVLDFGGFQLPRPATLTQDPYSFFNVDQVYDFLVQHGMHPYVELSSMPDALAAPGGGRILFYGFNTSEPADYAAWGRVVGDFARHMVDRYGLREVRKWPFEVWNEPNLPFFSGDEQAYFRLYRYAAEAIKDVDAGLQVGGPATSAGQFSFGAPRAPGPVYYRQFMEWATANNVPVDFGSAHGYETDTGAGPEGAATFFKLNRAATPAGLPLYISETNISASIGDLRLDKSDAAAGFLKTVVETVGVVDALAYWAFSDIYEEFSQADNPFSGSFGLITIHGIKKPAYRLMQILHKVGTRRVPLTLTGAPASVGGIATRGGRRGGRRGGFDVLLYNHLIPSGTEGVPGTPATPATVTIAVRGLSLTRGRARLRRIDEDHTNPYRAWVEMGSPEYPTRQQLRRLEAASELHEEPLALRLDPSTGDAAFTVDLPAESVAAVHLAP